MFSMLMLRDTSFDNMKLLFDRGARHVFFPPPHTPPHPHPHAMSAPASLPSFEELHFPRGTLRPFRALLLVPLVPRFVYLSFVVSTLSFPFASHF